MFKFVKTANDGVVFESDVQISTENNDATMDDLCEMFKSFLQACGYPVNFDDHVGIENDYDSENCTEKIELGLSDHEFSYLATIAHEHDITFNELVNRALKEKLQECKEGKIFDKFFQQLQSTDTKGKVKPEICVPGDDGVIDKNADEVIDEFLDKLSDDHKGSSLALALGMTSDEYDENKLLLEKEKADREPTKTNVKPVKAEDVMEQFKNKKLEDEVYDYEEYLE